MGGTVLACRVRTHGERGTAVGSGLIGAGAQGKIEAGDPCAMARGGQGGRGGLATPLAPRWPRRHWPTGSTSASKPSVVRI